MNFELRVTDIFGREVSLDHSNWVKHLSRHPEAAPYHGRLAEVLTDPDVVIEAAWDGHYHFYRRGITEGRFRNMYLRVVVEYIGDGSWGKIKTAWISSTVDTEGIVRWMRLPSR